MQDDEAGGNQIQFPAATVILAHGEKADTLYKHMLSRGVKLSKAKNPATIQAILGGKNEGRADD